jgi:hypothetical protein
MRLRTRLFVLASTVLLGCPAPEDTSPPPLFNAVDPSVQCAAGQIGWDFSTGGLGEVLRNSVGKSVKVIDATLGAGCGITAADLRAQCDGQEECPKPVSCNDADVNVTYVCGTETNTYKARVEGTGAERKLNLVCGLPITIKKVTYGVGAPTPADITTAVAAQCGGKRRCSNGVSGYRFNAFQDPWPNVSKQVEVRYVCGGQPTEFVRTVPDDLFDVYCGLEEKSVEFREPIRIISARPRMPVEAGSKAAVDAAVARNLETIRKACDGKLSCDFNLSITKEERTPWLFGKVGNRATVGELGWRQIGSQSLIVNFTCGEQTFENEQVFWLPDPDRQPQPLAASLKCGETMVYERAQAINETCRTVSGVPQCTRQYTDIPALTSLMKARCDGTRVCYSPGYDNRVQELGVTQRYGRLSLPDGGTIDVLTHNIRHVVTCGKFSPSSNTDLDHTYGETPAVTCPVFDPDATVRGIRVAEVSPADQTLAITKKCFGTDTCEVGGATVKYRCGTSPTLLTSSNGKVECRTAITITDINACFYRPPANYCQFQPGTCDYWGDTSGNIISCQGITVSYTCGQDPTVKQVTKATPTGERFPRPVTLTCPTLANPYVRKECVPSYCYGSSRRDDNLRCVTDSSLQPTVSVQTGSIAAWAEAADGGTSRFGTPLTAGSDGVFTLKSDFPYQVFTSAYYKTDTGRPLPDTTTATTWSYDQFEFADGGTPNPAVFGLRCILGEAPLRGSAVQSNVAGYQAAVMGGKGSAIPSNCFDQSAFNDERTSTFDAARSVGLEESAFRARYRFKQSWVVSSFDPHGKTSTRRYTNAAVAPNPIGFFYDPRRDWVNSLGYYAQRGDFARAYRVRFEPSTEIQLTAIDGTVDASELLVDVEKPDLLPGFDVNFGWNQRGSSSLNPYFQDNRLANNTVQTIGQRNLRVTVEMARADSNLPNPWEASNAVRFPTQPVGPGISLFRKTERVRVDFTPELRKRMLTVRGTPTATTPASPDGFMSDFIDEDTSFLVRACLDLDGLDRALGDTNINDRGLPAANGYTAKIVRRCSEPRTIVVRRQLFVRPVLPFAAEEAPNDRGAMARNGDRDVGGGNDNGGQVSCRRSCTVNADCGNNGVCTPGPNGTIGECVRTPDNTKCSNDSRSSQGSSGQFPLTMYSGRSRSGTEQTSSRAASDQTTASGTASAEMLGFTTFAPESRSASVVNSPTTTSFEVSISPNLQPIIETWKNKKIGPLTTNAQKALMKRRGLGAARGEKTNGVDGLGLAVGREFYLQIGPVPLTVEFSLTAGVGFELKLSGSVERSEAGMTSSSYPCINNTSTRCFDAEATAQTFGEAHRQCQLKGGRLAPVITQADSTAVNEALNDATLNDREVWLGAQAAYVYGYSPCANGGRWTDGTGAPDGGFNDRCRTSSSTGYFWLTGQRVAQQTGLTATLSNVANNGFPSQNFTLPASFIPDKAGLTYRRQPFQVSARRGSDQLPYVCQYDPATSVITQKNEVEFKIEASIGFGAALCLPSNKVGVCLAADIKFIALAIAFGSGSQNTSVFTGLNTAKRLRTVIGQTSNKGGAELTALSGSLSMQLRFLFWSKSFELKSFGPVAKKEWPFYENETPYFKETP